jgi:hypothetical protein
MQYARQIISPSVNALNALACAPELQLERQLVR